MRYRKKPVIIEAIKFTRGNIEEVEKFTNGKANHFTIQKRIGGKCYCVIKTLEGDMIANEYDYIIKGVKGEFYPCKPDIFEETYEKVIDE